MKKQVIDTIGMIIISTVIATFSTIIGANEKELRVLPMCILLFTALAYLISRKIILKQKIVIKNKIDIFVLLFMCSTMLPLIFNTYCTLQGTIEFILKYFFVYAMYLVVRNTVDSEGKVQVLTTVTIISSLIVIILGIDLQHGQYLKEIINKLNLRYSENSRFSSTFGYANAVAIYITLCIFLAIFKMQNAKSKIVKILNIIYVFLGFYIVYITMSRAVFILLIVGLLLYFAIYYYDHYKIIFKNKKKLILVCCILVIFITAIICLLTKGLKYSKPMEITNGYENILRYKFKPNHEYEIKLDINTEYKENILKNVKINRKNKENKSEIKIIEENIYRNKTTLASIQLENFNGMQTLKITPDSYLLRIIIEISNKDNETIIINKCYINNEENILNYKYIPNQIARLLKSFSLKEGSIDQRLDFYKDCQKIAKNNWLIGQGGNTWKKLSFVVQEYPYNIKETHSYFFELLISYGIIGVILFLAVFIGLNVILIKQYQKNDKKSKYKLAIIIVLDFLILCSLCFDFNMSFVIINLLVFMYIAALMYDIENKPKLSGKYAQIIDYVIFTCLAIILVILICASIAKYCVKDENIKKNLAPYNSKYTYNYINSKMRDTKDFNLTIEEIQKLMKNDPYYNQNYLYEKYWNIILRNKMNIKSEQLAKYLQFINNQYKTVKIATPMNINSVIARTKNMANSYLELKERNYKNEDIIKQIEELKQIIENEYNTNIVNIKAKERNGLEQEEIDKFILEYNEILEKIKE